MTLNVLDFIVMQKCAPFVKLLWNNNYCEKHYKNTWTEKYFKTGILRQKPQSENKQNTFKVIVEAFKKCFRV